MRRWIIAACLALAGCNYSGAENDAADGQGNASPAAATATDDPLASRDPAVGEEAQIDIPDSEPRPVMQAQVVLDRLGFTPGVVDGKEGMSTRNALSGFQEANGLPVTGQLDEATKRALQQWSNIPATRVVTIPVSFAAGPFRDIPEEMEAKAKLDHLGYETLDEKLAERFHTTVETLRALNPNGRPAGAQVAGASPSPTAKANPTASPTPTASATKSRTRGSESYFRAGQQVRVPNVGADKVDSASVEDQQWAETLRMLGVGSDQPRAARVVVSKSKGTMKVYDQADKLVAMYTATMGSERDPLPLGKWKVTGKSYNPPFNYNPDLFWDAKASDEKATIPPGPNGPVGVVWIDISKEHYGIHGTPEPETIGRAQSHGCIRLTNWDAARLAQMVDTSTQLLFEA
jgi:lipoprotein-anchoring transpeptidase ErfK/SrfK